MSRNTLSLSDSLGLQSTPRVTLYPFWPDEEIADRKIGTPGNSLAILNGFLPVSNSGTFPAPFSGTFGKCGYVTFDQRPDNVYQIGGTVLDKNFVPLYGNMRFRGQYASPYLNWRGTLTEITQDQFVFARNPAATSMIYFMIGRDISFSDVGVFEQSFRYGLSSPVPVTAGSGSIRIYLGEQRKRMTFFARIVGQLAHPLQVLIYQDIFNALATSSIQEGSWLPVVGSQNERYKLELPDMAGSFIDLEIDGGGVGETATLYLSWIVEAL